MNFWEFTTRKSAPNVFFQHKSSPRPRGLQRLRSFSKGLAYAHSQVRCWKGWDCHGTWRQFWQAYHRVCGPEWIQTLRGELLGRSVALILCGEVGPVQQKKRKSYKFQWFFRKHFLFVQNFSVSTGTWRCAGPDPEEMYHRAGEGGPVYEICSLRKKDGWLVGWFKCPGSLHLPFVDIGRLFYCIPWKNGRICLRILLKNERRMLKLCGSLGRAGTLWEMKLKIWEHRWPRRIVPRWRLLRTGLLRRSMMPRMQGQGDKWGGLFGK